MLELLSDLCFIASKIPLDKVSGRLVNLYVNVAEKISEFLRILLENCEIQMSKQLNEAVEASLMNLLKFVLNADKNADGE